MELRQVKGNTWVLEDWQLTPLYKLDHRQCILLDSGYYGQRGAMEGALSEAGLQVVGVLGSHAHNDHASNHRYFRREHGAEVVMSMGEAALCCTMENMKAYFFMDTLASLEENQWVNHMQLRVDRVILPEETTCTMAGVAFDILHLPGHSPDHIGVRTPDGIVYLADALLTSDELRRTRLPYHFCHRQAIASLEGLKKVEGSGFIAAHRGVLEELGSLPEENIAHLRAIAARMANLMEEPIHIGEFNLRACALFQLTSRQPGPVAMYERNIRAMLEYLLEEGLVEAIPKDGIFYYQKR